MTSRLFVRDTGDGARNKVGKEAIGRTIQPINGRDVGLAKLHFVAIQVQLRVCSAPPRRTIQDGTGLLPVSVDNYRLLVQLALVWWRVARIISLAML
jgi:hypothetical protein